MTVQDREPLQSYARLSEDGLYRYALGRRWGDGPPLRFVMLNPSTADASVDDPTIRRCVGFARAWGYDALTVLNLYALRATDPRELWRAGDPVGPQNDAYLQIAAESGVGTTVVAWGANARPDRVAAFRELFAEHEVYCLGVTKAGQPKHPLYLPASSRALRWPS